MFITAHMFFNAVSGNSNVDFECVEETDLILIHSNKLNHTSDPTLVSLSGGAAPTIKNHWLQTQTEYLVIHLNGKLTKGQMYRLSTVFKGELADDLGGFYRSVYTEDGNMKYVCCHMTGLETHSNNNSTK